MWTLLAAAVVFMAGIGLYNKLIKLTTAVQNIHKQTSTQ